MKKLFTTAALAATLAGTTAFAQQATITPSINVQPLPAGGLVVTPEVTATVPVGSVTVQPSVSAPTFIPPSGPPIVAPSVGVSVTIPIGRR